jgi:two-component system, OmpR family, response regulator
MNVLLVEDDVALGDAMASYLGVKGFAVERAASLRQAQAAVATTLWDVVLLDLHLPDGDGLSLIRAVRDRSAAASVIVLTARDHVSDRIRGLDSGADDYLVKPFDPDELMARLRAVERCRNGGTSALVKVGSLAIDLAGLTVTRNGDPILLTAKEWSLLRVLATRLDRIQLRESLQKALYGIADEATSNTLEVFICNLRRKLGPDSIQTVRGLGYRLTGGKG